ncbi:MAG: hypothetical protein WCX84_08805 [Syntrophales bacterium]|jgi:predicted RNA-binding Zn-ribbon protein involved in translation (DUF1610 family)|nr:hypothetical protein [Syntrophales bacterium]NLN59342.1 hypothetical protein [Deltaproteobacteria bacterium]
MAKRSNPETVKKAASRKNKVTPGSAERIETDKRIIDTGIFLPCFCPLCSHTLIEDDRVVLDVRRPSGQKGKIRLSPYLNVHESSSTIYIPDDEEVEDIFCPHCHQSLKDTPMQCDECGSAVARFIIRPFYKDIDFFICQKKNCHWHGIGPETKREMELEITGFKNPKDQLELIRTGTKLQFFCPTCGAKLVQGEDLTMVAEDREGRLASLRLSPYLNFFTSECSLMIPDEEDVVDLLCPDCGESFWQSEKYCGLCGSKAAKLDVRGSSFDADFYICMRRQCNWHGLSEKDCRKIILDDSLEW